MYGIVLDTDVLEIGTYDIKLLTQEDSNYLIFDKEISRRILSDHESAKYSRVLKIGSCFKQSQLDYLCKHTEYMIEQIYDEDFSCVLTYVFILLDIPDKCELIKDISELFGKVSVKCMDDVDCFDIDGLSIARWTETNDSINVRWFDRYNKKVMINDFKKKNHTICIK